MNSNPLSTYITIGTVAGGTAGVAQAIILGNSPLFSLVLATLSGAASGAIYAYVKLVLAARRNQRR
jgi:ABC-type uncharacterized transport system permease subunit